MPPHRMIWRAGTTRLVGQRLRKDHPSTTGRPYCKPPQPGTHGLRVNKKRDPRAIPESASSYKFGAMIIGADGSRRCSGPWPYQSLPGLREGRWLRCRMRARNWPRPCCSGGWIWARLCAAGCLCCARWQNGAPARMRRAPGGPAHGAGCGCAALRTHPRYVGTLGLRPRCWSPMPGRPGTGGGRMVAASCLMPSCWTPLHGHRASCAATRTYWLRRESDVAQLAAIQANCCAHCGLWCDPGRLAVLHLLGVPGRGDDQCKKAFLDAQHCPHASCRSRAICCRWCPSKTEVSRTICR